MSYVESEAILDEIRDMLSRYFAEKAQQEIHKLREEGTINDAVVEGWKTEHMRTPYTRMQWKPFVSLCVAKGSFYI